MKQPRPYLKPHYKEACLWRALCRVHQPREFGKRRPPDRQEAGPQTWASCYDRTLIQKTAEKSGLSPDFVPVRRRAAATFPFVHHPHRDRDPTFAHQGVPSATRRFFAQADVIRGAGRRRPRVLLWGGAATMCWGIGQNV